MPNEAFDCSTQVTHGLVVVEDGIKKPEEYAPPRKVRVELGFSVAVGEDFEGILDRVTNAANNRVAALLNGTALKVVGGTAAPAATSEQPPRTRRTKAQIAADKAAEEAAKKAAADDALPDEPDAETHLEDETDEELPDGGDDLGEFDVPPADPPAAVEEVTDADLNNAVQRKNGEIKNPDAIRKLIGSYNPDPSKVFQLRQIPAEKRAEFLTKLGELKAASA